MTEIVLDVLVACNKSHSITSPSTVTYPPPTGGLPDFSKRNDFTGTTWNAGVTILSQNPNDYKYSSPLLFAKAKTFVLFHNQAEIQASISLKA